MNTVNNMKTYIDMDGVLADFFSAAVKLSPAPHRAWREMEFRDVKKALEQIRNTPQFFLNLYPYPTANTLVQSVQNIAGGFSILSSPLEGYDGNGSTCAEEKVLWLSEHLHIEPEEIIITHNKPQYAAGNVLIDDYGLNVREWEAAGGYGIKYQADEDNVSDAIVPLMALYKNQP